MARRISRSARDVPQNPITTKGRIRVEMERRLRAAGSAGASVFIVRAGDFFGPKAGNNWFSHGLVKTRQTCRGCPLSRSARHRPSMAYLPDVAKTMVRLLEKFDVLRAG
jgi:nucleoside-diphosphate-sugar epimerase